MVAKLGQQIELLKGANTATKDEVSAVQIALAQVQHENTLLRCENSALHEGHQRQLQVHIQGLVSVAFTHSSDGWYYVVLFFITYLMVGGWCHVQLHIYVVPLC